MAVTWGGALCPWPPEAGVGQCSRKPVRPGPCGPLSCPSPRSALAARQPVPCRPHSLLQGAGVGRAWYCQSSACADVEPGSRTEKGYGSPWGLVNLRVLPREAQGLDTAPDSQPQLGAGPSTELRSSPLIPRVSFKRKRERKPHIRVVVSWMIQIMADGRCHQGQDIHLGKFLLD